VTALQRASEAGIEAWNRSLEGALELRLQSGPGTPDILIRGWGRPIFGSVLGLATFAHRHRASAVRARLGEVWIPLVEHPGTPALTRDPVDLYDTICHELGHCFGLDHCAANHAGARRNSVMGPRDWQTPPPAAPFLAERRAVLHWLQAAHRWRASEYRRRGEVAQAEIEESRAARLLEQAGRELWDGPFPPIGLELEDVPVPAPVRHYWSGNAAWRRRDREQARASYDQALLDGTPYPEVLVRRGWLQGRDSQSLADLRRALEITPAWPLAREALIGLLEAKGRRREADVERAVLRWLAGREKVEEYWLTAFTVSSRWVGAIAAVMAAGWAARSAVEAAHARIIKARRRPR
jgi:tetratricopeptide (TPR) repeat protein